MRCTRAGATGIAAAAAAVITVSASAFVSDTKWLVDQRDVLKSASDAAGIAATLEMERQLNNDPTISNADLQAILEQVAKRYVLLNLRHLDADRYARAEQTLVLQVIPDRIHRTVDVAAEADLGGIFMSRLLPFMAESVVSERMRVETVIETFINPVEVVLAIDISDSMESALDGSHRMSRGVDALGNPVIVEKPSRMDIVKLAATNLVAILAPSEEARVAIGVVPWSSAVRLDAQARDRWERNDWARYPTSRTYGAPYVCTGGQSQCPPLPPSTQTVASSPPAPWLGCLDEHRTGSVGTLAALPAADELLWPPTQHAFAQNYFAAHYGYSYECIAPSPPDMAYQLCYMPPISTQTWGNKPAQHPCEHALRDPPPPIRPLSTDGEQIELAIDALEPLGTGTYSTLGVLWAQRMLEHSWKDVWEGVNHPADPGDRDNVDLRKAIVLLTDGVDNYCGLADPGCENRDMGVPFRVACDVAKAAGSEIFVVTAMTPEHVPQDLADRLYACSSQSDNPDGTYVFVDNADPEALLAAFADIADQLRTVRRVY